MYTDPAEQIVPRVRDSEDPAQVTLFDVPDPPAGPEAEAYTAEDGKPEAFLAFMATDDGREMFTWLALDAHRARVRGDKRYSVLGSLHVYRATTHRRVNNSYAPWLSDELVSRYPALGEIIERRQRRKPGPTDGGS